MATKKRMLQQLLNVDTNSGWRLLGNLKGQKMQDKWPGIGAVNKTPKPYKGNIKVLFDAKVTFSRGFL